MLNSKISFFLRYSYIFSKFFYVERVQSFHSAWPSSVLLASLHIYSTLGGVCTCNRHCKLTWYSRTLVYVAVGGESWDARSGNKRDFFFVRP
jgi:hypothetical protein